MFSSFRGPLRGHVHKFTFKICFIIMFRGCIFLGIPWAELTNANDPSWSRASEHHIWFAAKWLKAHWKEAGKPMGKTVCKTKLAAWSETWSETFSAKCPAK